MASKISLMLPKTGDRELGLEKDKREDKVLARELVGLLPKEDSLTLKVK